MCYVNDTRWHCANWCIEHFAKTTISYISGGYDPPPPNQLPASQCQRRQGWKPPLRSAHSFPIIVTVDYNTLVTPLLHLLMRLTRV